MTARRLRLLVPSLVVVALLGVCAVQAGRDLGRFDGGSRIRSERHVGDVAAVSPSKGVRVDQDRPLEPKPGELAPLALVPAEPAIPAGGLRRGVLDAPDDGWQRPAPSGATGPRAPPAR